jgi:hypothetical protein
MTDVSLCRLCCRHLRRRPRPGSLLSLPVLPAPMSNANTTRARQHRAYNTKQRRAPSSRSSKFNFLEVRALGGGPQGFNTGKLVFISVYLYYDYYVNFDWCRKVQLHGDSRNRGQGYPECGPCTSGLFFPGVRPRAHHPVRGACETDWPRPRQRSAPPTARAVPQRSGSTAFVVAQRAPGIGVVFGSGGLDFRRLAR